MTRTSRSVQPGALGAAPWMMRTLVLGVLLAGPAKADAAPDEAVRALLGAADTAPDPERVRRLGPGVDAALRRAAADQALSWAARARAFALLGEFPSTETRGFLERAVKDPQLPDMLRARALHGFARGFAAVAPEATRALAQPLLTHGDERVRLAAKAALDAAARPPTGPPGLGAVPEPGHDGGGPGKRRAPTVRKR